MTYPGKTSTISRLYTGNLSAPTRNGFLSVSNSIGSVQVVWYSVGQGVSNYCNQSIIIY